MSLRELSVKKHEANEEAYQERMNSNISKGMYNPAAMVDEMHRTLHVHDAIPKSVVDKKTAMAEIRREVDRFTWTGKVLSAEEEKVSGQKITSSQEELLLKDMEKVFDLHEKCY